MTNRERYQRAFAPLHASAGLMEVASMNRKRKKYIPRAAIVCAAVALVLALAATAYAADLGGIRSSVRVWLRGEPMDAALYVQGDRYTVTSEDGTQVYGGGVAVGTDGAARPVTGEEIMEQLDAPLVEYGEDGSVWVYWRSQKVDIADRFEDGVCRLKLTEGGRTVYLTVTYRDTYAFSFESFPDPDWFGNG